MGDFGSTLGIKEGGSVIPRELFTSGGVGVVVVCAYQVLTLQPAAILKGSFRDTVCGLYGGWGD